MRCTTIVVAGLLVFGCEESSGDEALPTTSGPGGSDDSSASGEQLCPVIDAEDVSGSASIAEVEGTFGGAAFTSGRAFRGSDGTLRVALSSLELPPCAGSPLTPIPDGDHWVVTLDLDSEATSDPEGGIVRLQSDGNAVSTTGIPVSNGDDRSLSIVVDCPLVLEGLTVESELPIGTEISGSFELSNTEFFSRPGETGLMSETIEAAGTFSLPYCGDEA